MAISTRNGEHVIMRSQTIVADPGWDGRCRTPERERVTRDRFERRAAPMERVGEATVFDAVEGVECSFKLS